MQHRTFWFALLSLGLSATLLVILSLSCSAQATAATLSGLTPVTTHPRADDVTVTSGATVTTYLPFVTRNDCLHSLYDDFSDPSSGWYDGDTWWGEAGYFGGRYRIKVSEPDWLVVISFLEWMVPDEATIKVEAQSYFDTEFGLVFGYHPDSYGEMAGWYTFMIYPAEQWYELYYWRGNTGDQTLMAGRSTAIRQDYWPQTLEVRRSGSTYRLFINDVALRPYTADPDPFPGLGQVGVAFSPLSKSFAIAYYDDFAVSSPGCIFTPLTVNALNGQNVSPLYIERAH